MSHIAQVIHVSVLLAVITQSLVTFMISVRHELFTCCATTLRFAHGTFLYSVLLVIVVTCAASKMPVAFGKEFEHWRTRTAD